MIYFILAFLVSFILCLAFIKLNIFQDTTKGVQKFHKRPTPRIGGLALYTGLLATGITFLISGKSFAKEYLLLLLSAFPVFLAGILEDITKKVSPKWRLLAGFISGVMAFFLVSAQV
ncbi:MAG: glycosyltransferase, partial [Brevinematia bacterium]